MRESFEKYAKGSLAQAEVGAVAQKELSKQKQPNWNTPTDRTELDGPFKREVLCMQMGLVQWCVKSRRTMQQQR
jgi:hypothetical protein